MRIKGVIKLLILVVWVILFFSWGLEPSQGWCPSGRPPPPDRPPPTPSPMPQGVPRPGPGTGIEPFITSVTPAAPYWEVWWTRNRLKYLPFKIPLTWEEENKPVGTDTGALKKEKPYQKAFDTLIECLEERNANIRADAVFALAKLGDKDAIPYLKRTLVEDKNFDVRNVALLGLGVIGDNPSVNVIKNIISGEGLMVTKAYAAMTLGYLADKESIEVLKEVLNSKTQIDREILSSAVLSLGNLKDKSQIPYIGKILNDQNHKTEVRAYAALALGRLGDEDALAPLTKALADRQGPVRASVALALGLIKSPSAKDTLLSLLTRDKDSNTRCLAAISLGQLGDKSVYEPLLNALQKGDVQVQGFAALGLGLLGEEKAADKLRESLVKKKNLLARGALALALGLLKDKKSVPALIEIIEKEEKTDPVTWTYAILALGMIGDKKAVPVLEKVFKEAQTRVDIANTAYNNLTVALTLLDRRNEVISVLHDTISPKDKPVQPAILLRALHGIGYVGDKSSLDPLIKFIKAEKNDNLKGQAVFALGCVLDREKINPLYRITADNNFYIRMLIIDHILASKPD